VEVLDVFIRLLDGGEVVFVVLLGVGDVFGWVVNGSE
jgi:hypothetical protein